MPAAERTREPHCPHCGAVVTWTGNPSRPFCSAACKLIDLGSWLDEAYRVPGPPLSAEMLASEPRSGDEPRSAERYPPAGRAGTPPDAASEPR
jgi:endogenous inhibitor of DNA gyrase (YacG/DUF329 family)